MAASRKPTAKDEPNRRAEIVRAASRLFAEKGYAATPIRDIARAVDMQSGSPFYHFKTKHDMLKAVALEGIASISRAVSKAAERGDTPRATFEAMLLAHLEQLLGDDGRHFAATLLHESHHLDPAALAELIEQKDAYEALWQKALRELKRSGEIADDSRVTRLLLMGALNWTVQWYRPNGGRTVKQIARQISGMLLKSR
ncbi:TetR/AcrR family transcriptional regulator [Sulfuritalea sp.]|uniref:TetR/AcrR family transcriptional regulator n=1 Tax=Sulfuritalea sp. TaxID=2480090 RepID=UPI001AD0666C|nr:TetR/AcrR family transcriptional regulator [Sulfuritalea sp.]MBN8476728.1 TetR family transcriptional regulator [Sulfuritalea sp.]